jgi:antitoxin component YwqK of YwqJK toxin-antitoxin module
MRTLIIMILFFNLSLTLFSQYSIAGVIVEKYSKDSLMPLQNVNIHLIDNNDSVRSDKKGHFKFTHLKKGTYSIKFESGVFNKLILRNIDLTKNILLDTILLAIDYGISYHMVVHSAWSLNTLLDTFSKNGKFVKDTLTNNFYEQGCYRPGFTIPDTNSPLRDSYLRDGANYYRQGEWKWKFDSLNVIENYDRGSFNGPKMAYYDNGKKVFTGEFRENIRIGSWNFYDANKDNMLSVEFQNGVLIIDLRKISIKDYNDRIGNIYNIN